METRQVQRREAAALGVCSVGLLTIAVGMSFQGQSLSDYWTAAILALVLAVQTVYILVVEPDRERSRAWRVGQATGSILLFILGLVLLYFGMQELQQAFL